MDALSLMLRDKHERIEICNSVHSTNKMNDKRKKTKKNKTAHTTAPNLTMEQQSELK